MKYIVDINGTRVPVTLEGPHAEVDGVALTASLTEVDGTPARMLRVGDRMHRVVARKEPGKGHYTLWLDGWRVDAEALDERTRSIRDRTAAAAAASGPAPLVAPMPGLIVRVLVQPGDAVVAGQPLVVMEAMKMENELRSASAGTVAAVSAQPGTAVEKGTVLVQLS